MKPMLITRFASALLVATLALPVGALAQSSPGNPSSATGAVTAPAEAPPQSAPQNARPTSRHQAGGNMEERVERRIADLHAKLLITSAQDQQWQQFAQVMRDNARNMDQTFKERAQNFQSLNAVENMQSYAEIAQRHAQDVQRLVPAFQNLYNSLSDEQKRTADQVFRSYPEHSQQRRKG